MPTIINKYAPPGEVRRETMPRNPKCRRVSAEPANRRFTPQRDSQRVTAITVEELEAVRLCDLEGLSQQSAAVRMDVSRGTFQRILYAARKKIAVALVEGTGILVEGGRYQVSPCPRSCGNDCRRCPLSSGADSAQSNNNHTGDVEL